jgi:hypothetical protein
MKFKKWIKAIKRSYSKVAIFLAAARQQFNGDNFRMAK